MDQIKGSGDCFLAFNNWAINFTEFTSRGSEKMFGRTDEYPSMLLLASNLLRYTYTPIYSRSYKSWYDVVLARVGDDDFGICPSRYGSDVNLRATLNLLAEPTLVNITHINHLLFNKIKLKNSCYLLRRCLHGLFHKVLDEVLVTGAIELSNLLSSIEKENDWHRCDLHTIMHYIIVLNVPCKFRRGLGAHQCQPCRFQSPCSQRPPYPAQVPSSCRERTIYKIGISLKHYCCTKQQNQLKWVNQWRFAGQDLSHF